MSEDLSPFPRRGEPVTAESFACLAVAIVLHLQNRPTLIVAALDENNIPIGDVVVMSCLPEGPSWPDRLAAACALVPQGAPGPFLRIAYAIVDPQEPGGGTVRSSLEFVHRYHTGDLN